MGGGWAISTVSKTVVDPGEGPLPCMLLWYCSNALYKAQGWEVQGYRVNAGYYYVLYIVPTEVDGARTPALTKGPSRLPACTLPSVLLGEGRVTKAVSQFGFSDESIRILCGQSTNLGTHLQTEPRFVSAIPSAPNTVSPTSSFSHQVCHTKFSLKDHPRDAARR